MTEFQESADEISLLALGTILLRNRWRLLRWIGLGAGIAALVSFTRPALYEASASFVPQGIDAKASGLASLAGQLGVALPATNQSLSLEFYTKLLESRVLLLPIARDTIVVQELGGKRVAVLDLFEIPPGKGPEAEREEKGLKQLRKMVTPSMVKTTGVVAFSVETKWRSVSLAIATALIDGINDYNQRTRQGQAAAERKFVEGRVAVAASDLRAAEDRLQEFLGTNRNLGSPELVMQRDRFQRDLMLRQQVYTALTQSYEEARVREVRDTPVITIFESPWAATEPESRGRVRAILVGALLGLFAGGLLAFMSDRTTRRRRDGDTEAEEFAGTLTELKGEVLAPVRRLRERMRR